MKLLSIKTLVERARAAGFRVGMGDGETYVELYAPDHKGPDAVNWYGSVYSRCDVVLSDRPSGSYGYNGFFHGPWHHGMTPADAYGVAKLLSHPAMAEVVS